jgi:hypothetical protein
VPHAHADQPTAEEKKACGFRHRFGGQERVVDLAEEKLALLYTLTEGRGRETAADHVGSEDRRIGVGKRICEISLEERTVTRVRDERERRG